MDRIFSNGISPVKNNIPVEGWRDGVKSHTIVFMKELDKLSLDRRPTFLREWRKHKKLSQEKAAARLGIKQGTLSKIERRELPYNQDFLERVAEAYGCDPEDILSVNPLRPDTPRLVYAHVRAASPEKQREILNVVEAMLKAS